MKYIQTHEEYIAERMQISSGEREFLYGIASLIKKRQLEMDYSILRISKILQMPRQSYSRILTGEIGISLQMIARLAVGLQCTIADLLPDELVVFESANIKGVRKPPILDMVSEKIRRSEYDIDLFLKIVDRIQIARISRELTISALAWDAGYDTQILSEFLNSPYNCSIIFLRRLCAPMGIQTKELLQHLP